MSMGEFKRVFSKKLLILFIVFLVCNGGLFFYNQVSGHTINKVKDSNTFYSFFLDRYSVLDKESALENVEREFTGIKKYKVSLNKVMESETDKPKVSTEGLLETLDADTLELIEYYETLSDNQREIFEQEMKRVRDKLTYLVEYEASVERVIEQADNLKKFSVFAKKDSFSYHNIIRTSMDYERVADIEVNLDEDRAVDAFTGYFYHYFFAAILMLVMIYSMFAERENGIWQLTYSTVYGRVRLAFQRVIILMVSSFGLTLVLYGTTFAQALFMYGGWSDIHNPIQTLSTFKSFTHPISKLQYIFNLFFLSWIMICAMSLLIWMVFVMFRNRNMALLSVIVATGVEILLYQKIKIQSIYSALHHFNIVSFLKIGELYRGYLNWGVHTLVFSVISMVFYGIIVLVCFCMVAGIVRYYGMKPFTKTPLIKKVLDKGNEIYQKLFSKCALTFVEVHKLIITGKASWVIVFIVTVVIYFSMTGIMTFTNQQKEWDGIYLSMGGEDYSAITAMIDEKVEKYNLAEANAKAATEKYEAGEIGKDVYFAEIMEFRYEQQELGYISEFMNKQNYIERIQTESGKQCWMISDRGYEEIFGQYCLQREKILLIALCISIMLIISEGFTMEYRTGMSIMLRSSAKGRIWLNIRKIIACVLVTVAIALITYIIDLWNLYHIYGMPYLDAPLLSLTFMENVSWITRFNMTIRDWLIIRGVFRLVIALITMIVAIIMSRIIGRKRSRALTLLALTVVIGAVLVIPVHWGLI